VNTAAYISDVYNTPTAITCLYVTYSTVHYPCLRPDYQFTHTAAYCKWMWPKIVTVLQRLQQPFLTWDPWIDCRGSGGKNYNVIFTNR